MASPPHSLHASQKTGCRVHFRPNLLIFRRIMLFPGFMPYCSSVCVGYRVQKPLNVQINREILPSFVVFVTGRWITPVGYRVQKTIKSFKTSRIIESRHSAKRPPLRVGCRVCSSGGPCTPRGASGTEGWGIGYE